MADVFCKNLNLPVKQHKNSHRQGTAVTGLGLIRPDLACGPWVSASLNPFLQYLFLSLQLLESLDKWV